MKLEKISSICLVLRPGQQKAKDLAVEVAAWFAAKGIRVWLAAGQTDPIAPNSSSTPSNASLQITNPLMHPAGDWPDLVLVLGGDGTMLGALRQVLGTSIPVLGINLGQVGFLAGVAENSWQDSLAKALEHGLSLQPCMAIAWQVKRGGKIILQGESVNDVVLRGGSLAKLINLNLTIDDEEVGLLRADGLVLATPTGSSGYAFSAGGPLVQPEVEAFVLAPVSAFLNRMPPLIIGCNRKVHVKLHPKNSEVFLTSDGQEAFPLLPEDTVGIERSKHYAFMAFLPHSPYYAVLKDRGFIRE